MLSASFFSISNRKYKIALKLKENLNRTTSDEVSNGLAPLQQF
jgi:hypothetical protein